MIAITRFAWAYSKTPEYNGTSLPKQGPARTRTTVDRRMLDPLAPCLYELRFPGAVSGEAEVTCPQCGRLLTVPVDDPMGSHTCRCSECSTLFKVNWES
jgi:hypothetical protein